MSAATLFHVTGGFNVASDFLIFLWPAMDLIQVQVSIKQRVTLITMFSLGVLICVAGICRVWYVSVFASSSDVLCKYQSLHQNAHQILMD